jgi:hypothetical protein
MMMKPLNISAVILLLLWSSAFAQRSGRTQHLEIVGTVVAYDRLALANTSPEGVRYYVVRVDKILKGREHARYIRAGLLYPAGELGLPEKLTEAKGRLCIRLTRMDPLHDGTLNEFKRMRLLKPNFDKGEEIGPEFPILIRLSGAEKEPLPIGRVLPTYKFRLEDAELCQQSKRH